MPVPNPVCPICGSSKALRDVAATLALNLGQPFSVVRCQGCQLARLDPVPSADEYRLMYEVAYFSGARRKEMPHWIGEYAQSLPAYEASLTPGRIDAYRARLGRLAAAYPQRGTLLDVGMATGKFAAMAKADGWTVCGLDISESACQSARDRGIEAHCADLLAVEWTNRQFDVVHLHHVFEHFVAPSAALACLRRLLGPQSLLVVEVPSQFESWTRRLVNAVRRGLGLTVPRSVLSIHHPFFYSSKTIRLLMQRNGFDEVWCKTYFPERWSGPAYRQILRLIDFFADRCGRSGENVEIAVRRGGGPV